MKENINQMLEEKPLKMLFKLGIPAILMALFNEINGAIDTMFMGQFVASEAVSAMSVAVPFLLIIAAISFLFTEGAGIAISRYLGAKNIDAASRIFNGTIVISISSSVVIGVISFLFMKNILYLFNLDIITYGYALQYLKVIAIAMPIIVLPMVLGKMIYTEGHTKFLIKVTVIQILSNIILNYFTLAILKMGVIGAGIATIISFIIQSILMIKFNLSNEMIVKINSKEFKLTKNYFKEVIPLGMATFVTMMLLALTFGLESRVIASFGDKALAVQTITGNIFSITSSITSGIMSSALVLMSYAVGAKNEKRFFNLVKISAAVVFILSLIVNIPVFLYPRSIAMIFTDNHELIQLFVYPATIYSLVSPFIFTTNIVLYAMQPVGLEKSATIIFALQQLIFFAPLLYILKPFGFNYAILAQPTAEVIGGIITLFIIPIFIKNVKKTFRDSEISEITNSRVS
ncbi:MATE family efflux transporter [Clostridiaceae bacterium HSG29]|nr:MATE family efflux transporter [Clostridiaceae bacterium HSG29]